VKGGLLKRRGKLNEGEVSRTMGGDGGRVESTTGETTRWRTGEGGGGRFSQRKKMLAIGGRSQPEGIRVGGGKGIEKRAYKEKKRKQVGRGGGGVGGVGCGFVGGGVWGGCGFFCGGCVGGGGGFGRGKTG